MDSPALSLLVGIYCLLNLLAFGLFAFDKYLAKGKGPRISERTLLSFAGLGPFGALAGMRMFRHKIRQRKFVLVYAFTALHGCLLLWIWLSLSGNLPL